MLQCAFLGAFFGAFFGAVSSAFWCGFECVWVRIGTYGCVRVDDEN